MPDHIWLTWRLIYFSLNRSESQHLLKFTNPSIFHIMTTAMTVLRSKLPMDSVTIMVLNGSGSTDSMSKPKSTLIHQISAEKDFLAFFSNITITSTMINGALFLKWPTKTVNSTDTLAQLKPGPFPVFLWLGTLSNNSAKVIK